MLPVAVAILVMWLTAAWLYAYYSHSSKSKVEDKEWETEDDLKRNQFWHQNVISAGACDANKNVPAHDDTEMCLVSTTNYTHSRNLLKKSSTNVKNDSLDASLEDSFDPFWDNGTSYSETSLMNNICGKEVLLDSPCTNIVQSKVPKPMTLNKDEITKFPTDPDKTSALNMYEDTNKEIFSSTVEVCDNDENICFQNGFPLSSGVNNDSHLNKKIRNLIRSDISLNGRISKSSPASPTYTPPNMPSTPKSTKRWHHSNYAPEHPITCILPVKSPLDSVILKNRLTSAVHRTQSLNSDKYIDDEFQVLKTSPVIDEPKRCGAVEANHIHKDESVSEIIVSQPRISPDAKCCNTQRSLDMTILNAAISVVENIDMLGCSNTNNYDIENIDCTSLKDITSDHVVLCDVQSFEKHNSNRNCASSLKLFSKVKFFDINARNSFHFIPRATNSVNFDDPGNVFHNRRSNSKITKTNSFHIFKTASLNSLNSLRTSSLTFIPLPTNMLPTKNHRTRSVEYNSTSTISSVGDSSSSVSSITKLILTSTSTQLSESPRISPTPIPEFQFLKTRSKPMIRVISPEMTSLHSYSSSPSVSSSESSSSNTSSGSDLHHGRFFFKSDSLETTRIFNTKSSIDTNTLMPFHNPFIEPEHLEARNAMYHSTSKSIILGDDQSSNVMNRTIYDWSNLSPEHSSTFDMPLDSYNSFLPMTHDAFHYIDNSSQGSFRSDQSPMYPESFINLTDRSSKSPSPPATPKEAVHRHMPTDSGQVTPIASTNDCDKSLEDLNDYLIRYGILLPRKKYSNQKQKDEECKEINRREVKTDCAECLPSPPSLPETSVSSESQLSKSLIHDSLQTPINCITNGYVSRNQENVQEYLKKQSCEQMHPTKIADYQADIDDSSSFLTNLGSTTETISDFSIGESSQTVNIKNISLSNGASTTQKDVGHICVSDSHRNEINSINNGARNSASDDDDTNVAFSKSCSPSKSAMLRRRELLLRKRRRLISRLREQDIEEVLKLYFFSDPSTSSLSPLCSPTSSPPATAPGSPMACHTSNRVSMCYLIN